MTTNDSTQPGQVSTISVDCENFSQGCFLILEDNLSRDFLYQMSNIEYPYVNNDWLGV